MKELNKIQTAIFLLGGLLMAVGAGTTLLGWGSAPYIYALGALGFASMQLLQRYEGTNFTIRRLRRMQMLSDVLFLVAALLMFANRGNIFGLSYITYIEYVYNKWVITLLIAALLQLYSTHRIGIELEKEAKKL
jgi:fatty acid desaturase